MTAVTARPSSSWRYRIDPLPGGGSTVRQCFTHGPGASYLRQPPAKAPNRATEIIAARRDGLRANMSATLRAMEAVAKSSHGPASAQGNAHPAWLTGPRRGWSAVRRDAASPRRGRNPAAPPVWLSR